MISHTSDDRRQGARLTHRNSFVPVCILPARAPTIARMKIHIGFLCATVVATLISTGFSQTADKQTALDLGHVTVWLGMPQQEAMKRFSSAGYKVTEAGSLGVFLKAADDYYQMRFNQGRLVYAERSWYNSKQGDAFDAVLGALVALAGDAKNQTCTVSHQPVKDPDVTWERIFIFCGDRSVRIGKGRLGGTAGVDVTEFIGEPLPPDGK